MEQKDYLLREIEKIGLLLKAILNKLSGYKEKMEMLPEKYQEDTRELLSKEMGFYLDKFLMLDEPGAKEYINQFMELNTENLELLADILSETGLREKSDIQRVLFEKSLQLFEYCNLKDKTFSFDRENKIRGLKNMLL